jgi:hypothetical protein
MSTVLDTARALARLGIKGVVESSAGSADAGKLVKTDENGLIDTTVLGNQAALTTHIADNTKHLTSSQNTLLDALTVDATELNYVDGVTSSIQTQLNAKAADADLTTHIADATKHLTAGQNTLLDSLTATATELNYVVGVTSAIQTQFSNLNASNLVSGTIPDARFPATLPAASGVNLTALNATNLASGTVPDARFPATLPVASGVNLTALNASNLASGTVPDARFPATLPVASGVNLTALNATNLTSGTIPDARFPATLPAASGANLTALNASNISSGSLTLARINGYGTDYQVLGGNGWTYGVQTRVSTYDNISWIDLPSLGLPYANSIIVYDSSSSGSTVTVPLNSTVAFPIGTTIMYIQLNSSGITFTAAPGVTLLSLNGMDTTGIGAIATITKISTNSWVLSGNLAS